MDECVEKSPVRILATISNRSPYWTSAWEEPYEVMMAATQAVRASRLHPLQDEPSPLLLAKEKWHHRIFIVYDIGNDAYDAASAHRPDQNTFAVISVHLSTKMIATYAPPAIRQEVNRSIAFAHNANGVGSVPPFEEDHTCSDPPTYPDPRDPSLLGSTDTTLFSSDEIMTSSIPNLEESDRHKIDK
ncbi:hypothetical protein LTR47_011236 [Exophiala xenobiotica]|nr:hypothetical protein LTR47_011236 [Exophiala xenobiotica]KAK5243805.1 hypothetical protein LTS06_010501 [Exophiala xenobiotica]KAK5283120.1 hypothetical protein LTR40_002257 [Exophiala xenobiotica]KAK5344984.1 hypothetical protein LTR61_011245 [Exophiala xenobiotica]KAK5357587.1 hypothetical protein LTR11_011307 [Exophiala xenobiotica]